VLVQKCADAGLLGNHPVIAVVAQLSALCQGLASMELRGWWADTDLDSEQLWENALTALVDGLHARASAKNVRSPRRASRRRRALNAIAR